MHAAQGLWDRRRGVHGVAAQPGGAHVRRRPGGLPGGRDRRRRGGDGLQEGGRDRWPADCAGEALHQRLRQWRRVLVQRLHHDDHLLPVRRRGRGVDGAVVPRRVRRRCLRRGRRAAPDRAGRRRHLWRGRADRQRGHHVRRGASGHDHQHHGRHELQRLEGGGFGALRGGRRQGRVVHDVRLGLDSGRGQADHVGAQEGQRGREPCYLKLFRGHGEREQRAAGRVQRRRGLRARALGGGGDE